MTDRRIAPDRSLRVERMPLDDGLMLVRSHCCPASELVEKIAWTEANPTLVITFGLAGESGYVGRDGSHLRFRAGYTTLAAFSSSQGERRFAADMPVRQLRLVLGETALVRYLGASAAARLAGRKGIRALGEQVTAPWCRALLRSLVEPGSASPLDLHIAALSLAGEYLRALAPLAAGAPSSTRLTSSDVEKLAQARDLMQQQLDRALTIPYLCTAVGLNECKFKRGFRELFGITPHRLLLDMRMRRARLLLESGCQVAQVAYRVGYAHPANFSAAFTRYFGRTPKSVFG